MQNSAITFIGAPFVLKKFKIEKASPIVLCLLPMNSLQRGITFILTACCFFAGMSCFVRILEGAVSPMALVFYRSVMGLVLVWFMIKKNPPVEKGGRPFLLLFRGLAGTVALFAFFTNLQITSIERRSKSFFQENCDL